MSATTVLVPGWMEANVDAVGWRQLGLLRYTLVGYVAFLPMQFPVGATNFAPSDVFLALSLGLGIRTIRFLPAVWSAFHLALLGVFLMATFVTAITVGQLSIYVYVKIVGLGLLLATYAIITTAATAWTGVRNLLRVFIIAVVVHALAAQVAYFAGLSVSWMNYGSERLSGMLIDPNAFGGLLTVALVIHAATYFSEHPLVGGLPGILAILTLLAGIGLTLSRSAWIGCAVALVAGAIAQPRLAAGCAAGAAGAAAVLWLLLGNQGATRLMIVADRPNTAHQRIDQINSALPLFVESPVFGIGLGNFEVTTCCRPPVPGNSRVSPRTYIIHNTIVWILTECGLIGLVVFLCFIAWFFAKGVSAFKHAPGPEKPLVLGLVCAHAGILGLSVGIETLYQRHWWLVMALIASVFAISRTSLPQQRQQQARLA